MPISSFSIGLQRVLSFLPGTYGTSLIRNHSLNGVFKAMKKEGVPNEVIVGVKESIDCRVNFFGNNVSILGMYIILIGSILLLIGVYILINILKKKRG